MTVTDLLLLSLRVVLQWSACTTLGLVVEAERLQTPSLRELGRAFWPGFAILIAILQTVHLLSPIAGPVATALTIVGTVSLPWHLVSVRRTVDVPTSSVAVAAVLLLALGFASLALTRPYPGDTWLYHQQMVTWIERFPIVPGLGNLHHRFAYNNSYFLYIAASARDVFDHGPGDGRHLRRLPGALHVHR